MPLNHTFIDLGTSPPSNAYLTAAQLSSPETYFPLRVLVCDTCWLLQTEDFARADELFDAEYAYFSSYSASWLDHSKSYVACMVDRFGLDGSSLAVELAANDGYLLQYFVERDIPCLGVEPTHSTAEAARAKGIEILEDFFGVILANRVLDSHRSADLITANNVLAHVPDINDFVRGCTTLLAPTGVATFEFPHLLNLILQVQFDTIYHEHYSYLSLTAVKNIFEANGLQIFDVEELPTHGGSLRVFAQRQDTGEQPVSAAVSKMLGRESERKLDALGAYEGFQQQAEHVKDDFVSFLLSCRRDGRKVMGYGAAAKGNTLINFAGVRPDLLPQIVDANPHKAGKFMPGSRIEIVTEQRLRDVRPDRIVILPWNLSDEIAAQLDYARSWGAKFVRAVPELTEF